MYNEDLEKESIVLDILQLKRDLKISEGKYQMNEDFVNKVSLTCLKSIKEDLIVKKWGVLLNQSTEDIKKHYQSIK